MLCYRDRSYCGSATHKPDCDAQITPEEIERAEALGLPVAYINYCDKEDTPNGE